jgi:uncharacterized protein (TIGR02246 family)
MERNMASDVAQVHELWNAYVADCHSGDFEHWMSLWVDDAIQYAPGTPPRVGKEQIRAAWQPAFDMFIVSNMVIDTGEIRILGDYAYSHATYTFDMTPKEGGETSSFSGKYLDILKKQADGSWKMAIDCHNYNTP